MYKKRHRQPWIFLFYFYWCYFLKKVFLNTAWPKGVINNYLLEKQHTGNKEVFSFIELLQLQRLNI